MSTDILPQQGPQGQLLGMVVDGSLSRGVEVRLDPTVSVEDIKEGTYATIEGERSWFFGIITDVALGWADPKLKLTPPNVNDPLIAKVISGTMTYGSLSMLPMLTLPPIVHPVSCPATITKEQNHNRPDSKQSTCSNTGNRANF